MSLKIARMPPFIQDTNKWINIMNAKICTTYKDMKQ